MIERYILLRFWHLWIHFGPLITLMRCLFLYFNVKYDVFCVKSLLTASVDAIVIVRSAVSLDSDRSILTDNITVFPRILSKSTYNEMFVHQLQRRQVMHTTPVAKYETGFTTPPPLFSATVPPSNAITVPVKY